MKTTARALLLAALVLLPLVPSASAVGPEARPWTYNAGSDVAALALARDGTTIAAALATPTVASSGSTPSAGCSITPGGLPTGPRQCAQTDLLVLDHEYGYAQNLTYYDITPDLAGETALPPGRAHVAVSRDGTTIASLGREGQGPEERFQLYYARTTGNWSAAGAPNRTIDLGPTEEVVLAGLALSDDGRRVAVLYGQGGQYVLRGFTYTTALQSAFEARAPGTPRALAATGDLGQFLVAGQFPQGNLTHGGAYLVPFGQSTPSASFFDTSANGTDVRGAAMSRDGSVVAVSDLAGNVRLFRDAALAAPVTLTAAAQPTNLTMSEDGARLVAYANTTMAVFDGVGTPLWNVTVPGQAIAGVAMNRTGGLVVVGTSGTGGGVYAYSEDDARPVWQILGDTRAVAVDGEGKRVAYAQKSALAAVSVPRTISIELASGGKVAAQRVVASPGNTTFEVTLRNDGGATERVTFEEAAPGIDIAPASPIAVRPGDVLRANVTVSIDAGLVGSRVFNVSARSLTSGAIDNITVGVSPAPTLDVKLFVNETNVISRLGTTTETLLTIVNNGTADASVTLRATQTVSSGPLWNVTLGESSLTALRGTRTSVKVLVTPPPSGENGTASTVDFTLEGADVFSTARVVYRINPNLAVEVNATGVTRFIEPGARAFYNVTVTNTGSLPRDFDLFYTITSTDGRSWGVDMQSQVARLEPLGRRVLPVSIVAPADAQPDERVSVVVSARSLAETANETIVSDNVTLYGIAIPPKVVTTTPTGSAVPGPSALLALVGLALVAYLVRRRAQ